MFERKVAVVVGGGGADAVVVVGGGADVVEKENGHVCAHHELRVRIGSPPGICSVTQPMHAEVVNPLERRGLKIPGSPPGMESKSRRDEVRIWPEVAQCGVIRK